MKTAKKTVKKSTTMKKCKMYCENDYIPKLNKTMKQMHKRYGIAYKTPTKKEKLAAYNACKKTFCNEKCEGYDSKYNPPENIENGFQKTYTKSQIQKLKKKGALSGCVPP
jgi:hypothetical protein